MPLEYTPEAVNRKLMRFVDRSPCAFYAVSNLKEELRQSGFRELKETEKWKLSPGGKYFVSRNGSSLISFCLPEEKITEYHVIASHSDSPSFKLKPGPALRSGCGILRAAVEKYGGPIDSTWFDRPLSLSGRIILKDETGLCERLVFPESLTLLLPSVAPHLLRREQGEEKLNQSERMFPVLGCSGDENLLWARIAEELEALPEQILGVDLFLCNREPALIWGLSDEFLSAPRLDDLACCYASFLAFLDSEPACGAAAVHCVFDNEEVGSRSLQGADSSFLRETLERIAADAGLDRESYFCAVANSLLISADNAHAVHPNYEHLSDPENRPSLNGGIAVKYQAAQRYATDGVSAALFKQISSRHHIPVQEFTNRPGSSGGSTLGNLSISQVSIPTADIGLPQLAMHSCYETIGTADTAALSSFASAFYREKLPEIREQG